ncbi:hypothetical protein RHS01_02987 [Rhizoctonia solani]|uniref:IncA domain-containing protein n=1 Tax=Rhizoctonia solani TaxID=456999 RepID=A0A8H7IIN0_9AGAM|nr:hypothetical protein RHS01_02987 [Rhizoctonia solani]
MIARVCLQRSIAQPSRRLLTTNAPRFAEASSTSTGLPPGVEIAPVKVKRPIGGLRGGIFGFLLGFSLASAYASYHLLEEYQAASAQLQASVEELQASTARSRLTSQVSSHVRRIEEVEKDLKALAENTSSKEDLQKARSEAKKLVDGLHIGMKFLIWKSNSYMDDDPNFRVPRLALSCLGNA